MEIAKTDQINLAIELNNIEILPWSDWLKIPTPDDCRNIKACSDSGVYQIRDSKSKVFIQFGISKELQYRMQSFFPKPFGRGTRNNESKRQYILDNWKMLEYRYLATESRMLAATVERFIHKEKNHLFNT